jgi:hypothetical protein
MSLNSPSPRPQNKHNNIQYQFLSLYRLQQLTMPSRLTVVLVSLLLDKPAVIFWFWVVNHPKDWQYNVLRNAGMTQGEMSSVQFHH